jgi:putative aldouronate transport system substrate-binding protein
MIAHGDVGVWCGACENVADFQEMTEDENFSVIPLGEFKLDAENTEINHFGSSRSLTNSSTSVAISTGCKDVVTAVEFLNYFYTEDGIIYANYGVQGYAWDYDENGDIQRTELVTNNADVRQDTAVSVFASIAIPTIAESSFNNNWSAFQVECINLWNSDTDAAWQLPDYLSLTVDETSVVAQKLTDVNTYASEYITKFINGDHDIETEWDSFQETLVQLGIEEVIDIYQDAVDRYNNR